MENSEEKRVRMMDYMVHFVIREKLIEFSAYPVTDWKDKDGKTGVSYHRWDSSDFVEEFDESECRKDFSGTIRQRGILEGRLYFNDDEYFAEDLQVMSELYNEHIFPWCKQILGE